MTKKHTEAGLEDAIEHCLVQQHAYQQGQSQVFDVERAQNPYALLIFY